MVPQVTIFLENFGPYIAIAVALARMPPRVVRPIPAAPPRSKCMNTLVGVVAGHRRQSISNTMSGWLKTAFVLLFFAIKGLVWGPGGPV